MIDQAKFELVKTKHGHYASWAIWAPKGEKPKDNTGDLTIFETENHCQLLSQLNPNILLVGLNISRKIKTPLGNFHDPGSRSMDFKIRYALENSPFWGGYMTDIIKDFEQKSSGKMMDYLKSNKQFEEENILTFREELHDLGTDNPTIIAFGNDAAKILDRNFKNEFKIFKILHYSYRIGKEKYRKEVKTILGFE